MTDFKQWLVQTYHEQAHQYRVALEREVWHVKRIYPTITHDVRKLLLQSLKEIQVPTLPEYTGKDSNLNIYNATPKPNFILIMREVVAQI